MTTLAMQLSVLEALHSELTPDTWTQGASARDSNGNQTFWERPDACRWCITAKMTQVINRLIPDKPMTITRELVRIDLYNAVRRQFTKTFDLWALDPENPHSLRAWHVNGLVYFNDDPDTDFEDIARLIQETLDRLKTKNGDKQ